jgi:predicted DNA-binding transcriptional regulator YafY
VAKDTEKLIRQLSLISYLMAERRPVTATEIRRDVEGYSDMTEDAFARRFYADRAELDALGIHLTVDKPADGFSEQENYSLAPEAFHLPAIAFTDSERAALQTALTLLDGEFAYAEPLRLALQQITWGRPSPLGSDSRQTIGLGITASAGGAETSGRLAKIDTAIYRRKRIEFEYFTMQTGATAMRRVDPYHLLFEGGQWYLVGHSHERGAIRVFRLSRIQGKVAYSTKAEHDFQRPADFDARRYANRINWQLGDPVATGEVWVSDKIAWYVERQYGDYGELAEAEDGGRIFRTQYAIPRLLVAWALRFGEDARIIGPPELVAEARERIDAIIERHRGEPPAIPAAAPEPEPVEVEVNGSRRGAGEPGIRPERFARLVTLASVLIAAGREGRRLPVAEVCDQLQISEQELREDVSVLNVVNFGGGAYVIYAEVLPSGEIEVDPEPYSDTFDRPARLLPIEANALVAAIDLIGPHLARGALDSAREKIVAALGHDPVEEGLHVTSPVTADEITREVERAVHSGRRMEIEYWAPNEDVFTQRVIEPYALFNSIEAWYVAAVDPAKDSQLRHFRLDRIKRATLLEERFERREDLDPVADIGGWPRTGEVGGSRVAKLWVSPEQARWAREERTVVAELPDGAIVVERAYKGIAFLVREVLKEAGDAAVLEPAEAREAVLAAAEALLAPSR